MNPQILGMCQIIIAAVCWGCLGVLSTFLNRQGFSGMEAASLRVTSAAVLLLVLLPWFARYLKRLSFRQLPALFWQSMLGMFGMTVFYFGAVAAVGSSLAVALLYTAPVWSLIFARILLGEGITRRSAALTVLAACGVGLTMAGIGQVNWFGIGLGLMSGVCYALYGVLGKRAMGRNPPMLVLFTSVFISAVAMAFLPDTHQAWQRLSAGAPSAWLAVAALAVIGTLLPYALYIKGLEKMPAARASVFTVIEPLTAVALAAWWLHESLNLWQYVGVALIIGVSSANAWGGRVPSAKRDN